MRLSRLFLAALFTMFVVSCCKYEQKRAERAQVEQTRPAPAPVPPRSDTGPDIGISPNGNAVIAPGGGGIGMGFDGKLYLVPDGGGIAIPLGGF